MTLSWHYEGMMGEETTFQVLRVNATVGMNREDFACVMEWNIMDTVN